MGGGQDGRVSSVQGVDLDDARRVREAFLAADYTTDGVLGCLGPTAHAALARNETVPARRATADGSALATFVRLFVLQLAVPEADAARALPLDAASALGLVARDGGDVRAKLDVRPYGDENLPWWVVSDLGTGLDGVTVPLPDDHVIGVGGASATLAQVTVRPPVHTGLDLGTGCGVQALHLGQHCSRVVATDILPRALAMARLTAAMSELAVDLREGNLFEPVVGERFDLVVSNPPFVVSAGARFTYRDSGLPLDEVCRRLVAEAPAHLTDGGWCQLLANWVHLRGEDWAERVASWIRPTGLSGWAVQREVQDPAAYVATWLRDSGEEGSERYVERYDGWLRALEDFGVEGIGFGWISLHSNGVPSVYVEDWPHAVEQPLGPHVLTWFDRQRWLALHDGEDLLKSRLITSPTVVQEQVGRPGAEDPIHVVLRSQTGMCRAETVDTMTAGLVGACDGTLTVGQILDAIATLMNGKAEEMRRNAMPRIRRLVAEGLLIPAG
jgi:methylase of polypeptide subunit release factors